MGGSQHRNQEGAEGSPTVWDKERAHNHPHQQEGERGGLRGMPSQQRYLETVYKMVGEEVPENMVEKGGEKGFSERLFNRCVR